MAKTATSASKNELANVGKEDNFSLVNASLPAQVRKKHSELVQKSLLSTALCCFLNSSRADTARTHANTFHALFKFHLDPLEIRHPSAFSPVVGVTYIIAH